MAEVVELGDLKPQEVVKVTAWASGFTDEDKLKIVYASGIGTIQFLKPGDPFWNWFAENWGDLFFGIFIILFFMLIITGAIVLKRRGSKQVAPTS